MSFMARPIGGSPPMPSFVGAGAGTSVAGLAGTISPAYPGSIVGGQFLLIHIAAWDSSAPTVNTPAGFTALTAEPTGTQVGKQFLYWKIATGSESGTVAITITQDGGAGARIYQFSSGSGGEAIGGSISAPSSTTMSATNVTTTGPNRLAIQLLSAPVNTTIGNITTESGTDYTEAIAEFASATGPVIMSLQTGQMPVAGAITGGSATLGAAAISRLSYGFAITP